MSKILITAAGTGAAFSYANSIAKSFPELEIVTADINEAPYTTAALFANKHYKVPLSTSSDYQHAIASIIEKEDIDFYLPLLDLEIEAAQKNEVLKNKLVANNGKFCQACIEKDNYHTWAFKQDIATPAIVDIDRLDSTQLYVLKKNGGFGSRDTKVLSGKDILDLDTKGYSIYEHISGTEYTIDCFPDQSAATTTVRERVEVKNGVSVKTKITQNPYLNTLATKMVQTFGLTHPFCFQVIEQEGIYYMIDVNPRLGGGTAMSAVAGCDYFSAHIAYVLGQDPKPYLQHIHESCIVTRQYANYLMQVL